jgi:hypothetical protein
VVRDLLDVEGLLAQQLTEATTRRSGLLLEVVDVASRLDREVVERADRTGAQRLVDASLAARMLRCGGLDGGVGAACGGVGRAEPRQLDAGRRRLGRSHLLRRGVLDGDRLLHRRGDRGLAQLADPGLENGGIGRPVVRSPVVGDLAHPADEVRYRAVVGVARSAQLDAPIAQPALGAVEAAGLEHLLEQGVALLRACPQEGLEPALRQQCDLAELGERHADEPGHEVPGLVEAGAERVPGIGAVVARPTLGDDDAGLLRGGALAAALGSCPGGGAVDPEPATRQRRLEDDPRGDVGGRVVGAQPLGRGAVAGHVAVEGEADGVEDAGLPRTRGTAEQEQARVGERVEVDACGLRERTERDHLEFVKPHVDAPPSVSPPAPAPTRTSSSGSWQQASKASWSSADSAGVASTPRT